MRPKSTTLMGLSDAAFQCLLYTNGLWQGHGATKHNYMVNLLALLDRDLSKILSIPEGLDRVQHPSLPPCSQRTLHRPLLVSPRPRCTSPDPRGASQGAGASNAPPHSSQRLPSLSSQRDAQARH